MNDWTKGYTMTQGMKEIAEHIESLQALNAELLAACRQCHEVFVDINYNYSPAGEMVEAAIAAAEASDG